MLTKKDIEALRGLTCALKVPFAWREGAEGLLVHFGADDVEQEGKCRTLRDALCKLALRAPQRIAGYAADGADRVLLSRQRGDDDLDLVTGSD